MKILRLFLTVCLSISVISTLPAPYASSEESGKQELNSLITEAIANNPKVQADYQKWIAKTKKAKQVGALPNPKLSYTYFGENIETKVGPEVGKYGVSQVVPFPGKLSLKSRAVQKDAEILLEKYKSTKRDLIKDVKFNYYNIYWVDKAIVITEEEKSILENLEKVAQRKFETNHAPQQDVIKAQVEISKLIDQLYMLSQRRRSLGAKLNTLLNRSTSSPIDKITNTGFSEFKYKLEDLQKLANRNKQELVAANLDIEKSKYERSLAGLDYLPDFSFGFDYIQIDDGHTTLENDGQDAWSTTFAVHVPIWLDKQVAEVREKQASLMASRQNYEDVKNNVIYEVEDAYYRIATYRDIVSLYKTALIPQTEQSFEAARTGYETGKVDFLNWLDAERILLQTKLAYYKAIVDYEKSIAYLEKIVGIDL